MYRFKNLEFWLVVTVVIFFVAGFSNAAPLKSSKYKVINNSLSEHIRKDLNDKKIYVEIDRVAEMQLTTLKQTVFGEAHLILNNKKQTPIYFEAIFNTLKNKVDVVDYTFVENSSEINTDFLQKLLIKNIGNDYKTREVAVSMDEVNKIKETGNTKKFRGYGEVRIGSLIWKKVKFEITLQADSEKVLYKLSEM